MRRAIQVGVMTVAIAASLLIDGPALAAANSCLTTQVTNTTGADNLDPSIDGTGTRIVFASSQDLTGANADGNLEIFLYDEGAGLRQLTDTTGATNARPALSADGSTVAFTSTADLGGGNPDGNFDLFLLDVATGVITQVTTAQGGGVADPAIDADGGRVAFTSGLDLTGGNADGSREVFLYDVATATTTQVSDTVSDDNIERGAYYPALDGAGAHVVYEVFWRGWWFPVSGASVILYDSAARTSLGIGQQDVAAAPAIDAAGEHVVYTEYDKGYVIRLRNLASGVTSTLERARDPRRSDHPVLSDDGSRVGFWSDSDVDGRNPDHLPTFFLVGSSGNAAAVVATHQDIGAARAPSIDGDGRRLAFAASADLAGTNRDGNVEIYLVDCTPVPTRPDALIRRARQSRYKGDEIHNTTAAGQSVGTVAAVGQRTRFVVTLQDDGTAADGVTVRGDAGGGRFRVRYFNGPNDVTDEVVAGTYDASLAGLAGFEEKLDVRVTPTRAAAVGASLLIHVTATSNVDRTSQDVVAARVTVSG